MKYLFALLLLLSAHAGANIIYTWEGECTFQCVGTAHAKIVMREGYVPGDSFIFWNTGLDSNVDHAQIDHFAFDDNVIITPPDGMVFTNPSEFQTVGALPENSGATDLRWCFNSCTDWRFSAFADGTWNIHFELESPNIPAGVPGGFDNSSGIGSRFTLFVPEPGTLALLSGVLGIVLLRGIRRYR